MNVGLQGSKLNYPTIHKQACVVYKAVKHFMPYLLKAHMIMCVPLQVVRTLIVQQELGERRVKWMACLQEHGLEFKLIHTIKGCGICWLEAKAMDSLEDPFGREQEIEMYNIEQVPSTSTTTSWYTNI